MRGYRSVVVLTGAGISRSAGLATYRGPGGLWSDRKVAELAHASALVDRRDEACEMFWGLRRAILRARPTAAHRALAAYEAALPEGARLLIVTQNVDGLHQAAGSRSVCEYHGSLARWRCETCGAELAPEDAERPPRHCDRVMRPAAVLFGEPIPVDAEHTVKRALRDCDLFVAIGTSGTVTPASAFVRSASYAGARTVLINLEAFDGARELFDEVHVGEADELVPTLFAA